MWMEVINLHAEKNSSMGFRKGGESRGRNSTDILTCAGNQSVSLKRVVEFHIITHNEVGVSCVSASLFYWHKVDYAGDPENK